MMTDNTLDLLISMSTNQRDLALHYIAIRRFLGVAILMAVASTTAFAANFTGVWSTDLCIEGKGKPCGRTVFSLIQNGSRVCGDHTFMTANASRMNEGFPGSVRGTVVGNTAVLVVTSGRNNGTVIGKALITKNGLSWETLEEISSGDPEGDSPLIYDKGVLKYLGAKVGEDLRKACH